MGQGHVRNRAMARAGPPDEPAGLASSTAALPVHAPRRAAEIWGNDGAVARLAPRRCEGVVLAAGGITRE